MAFKPSSKRKMAPKTPEANLTPIMNLMVVLIPMLLAVAQYVQVSLLDYQPPPAEELADEAPASSEKRLDLVVNVLPTGFEVSTFGATRGKDYRFIKLQRNKEHDIAALSRTLRRIRDDVVGAPIDTVTETDPVSGVEYRRQVWKYADADVVSIAARGGTPWQLVVRVMDATRSWTDSTGVKHNLFPLPRLGQIQ